MTLKEARSLEPGLLLLLTEPITLPAANFKGVDELGNIVLEFGTSPENVRTLNMVEASTLTALFNAAPVEEIRPIEEDGE